MRLQNALQLARAQPRAPRKFRQGQCAVIVKERLFDFQEDAARSDRRACPDCRAATFRSRKADEQEAETGLRRLFEPGASERDLPREGGRRRAKVLVRSPEKNDLPEQLCRAGTRLSRAAERGVHAQFAPGVGRV